MACIRVLDKAVSFDGFTSFAFRFPFFLLLCLFAFFFSLFFGRHLMKIEISVGCFDYASSIIFRIYTVCTVANYSKRDHRRDACIRCITVALLHCFSFAFCLNIKRRKQRDTNIVRNNLRQVAIFCCCFLPIVSASFYFI